MEAGGYLHDNDKLQFKEIVYVFDDETDPDETDPTMRKAKLVAVGELTCNWPSLSRASPQYIVEHVGTRNR